MSIEGSITALVTPMNEKGDLDYNSLEKLINFQMQVESLLIQNFGLFKKVMCP